MRCEEGMIAVDGGGVGSEVRVRERGGGGLDALVHFVEAEC